MDRASYYMAIIIQQDTTEYSSFTCVNSSKSFVVFQPSSGAHGSVSTLRGIYETCTVDTVLRAPYEG